MRCEQCKVIRAEPHIIYTSTKVASIRDCFFQTRQSIPDRTARSPFVGCAGARAQVGCIGQNIRGTTAHTSQIDQRCFPKMPQESSRSRGEHLPTTMRRGGPGDPPARIHLHSVWSTCRLAAADFTDFDRGIVRCQRRLHGQSPLGFSIHGAVIVVSLLVGKSTRAQETVPP